MCFTDAKKTEIMSQHGVQKKDVILKMVANEWKSLSASARTHWEEEARNDKIRFVSRQYFPSVKHHSNAKSLFVFLISAIVKIL